LLLNLSKGHIGEDNSALLGAMMITKMQLAAMSRVDTPEEERRLLYVGMTRAKNRLVVSSASDEGPISRFIQESGIDNRGTYV